MMAGQRDKVNLATLAEEVEAARIMAGAAVQRLIDVKTYNRMVESATYGDWEPVDELVQLFLEERVKQLTDDWRNVAELVTTLVKELD